MIIARWTRLAKIQAMLDSDYSGLFYIEDRKVGRWHY